METENAALLFTGIMLMCLQKKLSLICLILIFF